MQRKKCNIQSLGRMKFQRFGTCYGLSSTTLISGFARTTRIVLSLRFAGSVCVGGEPYTVARASSRRNDVYNILWAVVFGFATLNILSLAAQALRAQPPRPYFRRVDGGAGGFAFDFSAGLGVVGRVHIFPIKLHR